VEEHTKTVKTFWRSSEADAILSARCTISRFLANYFPLTVSHNRLHFKMFHL